MKKRSMFYNYDMDIDAEVCDEGFAWGDEKKTLDGFSGERLISDAKGNYHGIQAHKGQDINLVFSFSGTIEGVDVLEDYLNSHTMTVNILNCKHQVVLSKIVTETVIGNVLETIISQTDNDLLPDIYRMQLVIESEDGPVTLFAERDSFIRIVE